MPLLRGLPTDPPVRVECLPVGRYEHFLVRINVQIVLTLQLMFRPPIVDMTI